MIQLAWIYWNADRLRDSDPIRGSKFGSVFVPVSCAITVSTVRFVRCHWAKTSTFAPVFRPTRQPSGRREPGPLTTRAPSGVPQIIG
jgi:hypothetical protein